MKIENFINAVGNIDEELIYKAKHKNNKNVKTLTFRAKRSLLIGIAAVLIFAGISAVVIAQKQNQSLSEFAEEVIENNPVEMDLPLEPVGTSVTKDGIEMTVISAGHDEKYLNVLFSLRDKSENRIDESTGPLTCDVSFPNTKDETVSYIVGRVEKVEYDRENRSCTYRFGCVFDEENKPDLSEIVLSVDGILSGLVEEKRELEISLGEAERNPEILSDPIVIGVYYENGITDQEPNMNPLTKSFMQFGEPKYNADRYFSVTGTGYFDGRLHIQVKRESMIFPKIYISDKNGNTKQVLEIVALHDSNDNSNDPCVFEYIFDIKEEDLSNYSIFTEINEYTTSLPELSLSVAIHNS